MSDRDETTVVRRRVLRSGLIAATAFAGALLAGETAYAACSPTATSNATATCTGTTINQQLGAPGTSTGTEGYGGSSVTNLNVTVVSGATVTGSDNGLKFGAGTVSNFGSITGSTNDGIQAGTTAIVTNTGTITGAKSGILGVNVTLLNSGTIASNGGSSTAGIAAAGTAAVTNSGNILANNFAIIGATGVAVTNSGVISGAGAGIKSSAAGTVINSGTITAGTGDAIVANTALTLTNSGTITGGSGGGSAAVQSGTTAAVINSGIITGVCSKAAPQATAMAAVSGPKVLAARPCSRPMAPSSATPSPAMVALSVTSAG